MTRHLSMFLVSTLLLALGACGGDDRPPSARSDAVQAQAGADDAAPPAEPVAAPASANEAMHDVFERFKALRSFHATMRVEGAPQGTLENEMDYVAPDRYRMTMKTRGMQVTQTMIGNDVYVSMGDRSMKTTMQGSPPGRWHEEYERHLDTMRVEAQGSESIDGVDTRKYLIRQTQPTPSEALVWIDDDDLVRQARIETPVEGKPTTTTIRYSRFDDPGIRIDAP